MNQINISIVIVSWRVKDLLKSCLSSIYANQDNFNLEVFVVDNASGDGTVEMLRHDYPQVKLIANSQNLGFARANNLAIIQATGEFILLLNPDTEINPGTLKGSVEFFRNHPKGGALGPQMLYPNGSTQPSVRRFPGIWPISLMLLKIPKILPQLKSLNDYLATDFDYHQSQTVEQIMGAYIFMPRSVLNQVGRLDERFFIWFEEVDLCRQLIKHGYEIWYEPTITIIHHGGKSFAQQAIITNQWVFFSSALKYFLKYGFKRR